MRPFLACLAGIVVAALVVLITETIGHLIFPPPDGLDLGDPDQYAAMMDQIPLGAKVAVLVAWGLGVLAGCFTALKISRGVMWTSLVVTGLMLAMMAMTLYSIPHPVWMIIGAFVVTLFGWLGARQLAR